MPSACQEVPRAVYPCGYLGANYRQFQTNEEQRRSASGNNQPSDQNPETNKNNAENS